MQLNAVVADSVEVALSSIMDAPDNQEGGDDGQAEG